MGEFLCNVDRGKGLLTMIQNPDAIKVKTNTFDYIKKFFNFAQKTLRKINIQMTSWERIFVTYIKGRSNILNRQRNLKINKTKNIIEKLAK